MREVELRQHMVESGFQVVRATSNGGLTWTDGVSRIVTPKKFGDLRGLKNLLSEVKRAVALRESVKVTTPVEKPAKKDWTLQPWASNAIPQFSPQDGDAVISDTLGGIADPVVEEEEMDMKPQPILNGETARKIPAPVKGPRSLPDLIMAILTDPDLSDTQKVKMITAYTEI
jgi:hypothetical protein